jgi:hypothetical protein
MNKNKINKILINTMYFLLPITMMSIILMAIHVLVEIYKL